MFFFFDGIMKKNTLFRDVSIFGKGLYLWETEEAKLKMLMVKSTKGATLLLNET